tara:strand:- start:2129 stop:3073 length:945 start_codon:yes stop_codon:yes gene_type:complete
MSLPLKYDGDLREFSTAERNRLSYLLRVAYSNHLNAGSSAQGSIYVANSGNTSIGSLVDHRSTAQINTNARNFSGGADYPGYPSLGTSPIATYNYRQNRNTVTAPSNSVLDDHSYVYIFNTSHIRVAGQTEVINSIVDHAITQLRTGDEVGSYRVSVNAPDSSAGGAGTWTDKGTWFQNTTFSAGTTTYKLWLKRSLSSVPGTAEKPLRKRSDHDLQRALISTSGDLIQNVLLPIMINRGLSGTTNLQYNIGSGTVNRGEFKDTKQTGSTTSQGFASGQQPGSPFSNVSNNRYWRTRVPSGSASNDGVTNLFLV